MNLREFLHFYDIRCAHDAQWEIRQVAEAMWDVLEWYDDEWDWLLHKHAVIKLNKEWGSKE